MTIMKTAYCIKCGNKFPEEAEFCPYCGTKVYRPEDDAKISFEEIVLHNNTPITLAPKTEEVIASVPITKHEKPANNDVQDTHAKEGFLSDKTADKNEEKTFSYNNITFNGDSLEDEDCEDPSIGVCILAFLIPVAGFIAAISNRKTNKKKSKAYAMWAWIGFGLEFIMRIIQSAA